MKKLLLILLFAPFLSVAQKYSEVIEIPNKTSEQLYKTAKEWFALTFKSSNDVIQLDDPVDKKIIGKGIKEVKITAGKFIFTFYVHFTLMVQFKDGRYKYELEPNEIKDEESTYTYEHFKKNKETITEIDTQLQNVINQITMALKKDTKNDNW